MKAIFGIVSAVSLLGSAAVQAEDLLATLDLTSSEARLTADSKSNRAEIARAPRAVLEAHPDEPLTLHWSVRNPGDSIKKDILVHFFVVKETDLNQPSVPDLRPEMVALEGAVTSNFTATNQATGTMEFRLHDRGTYLVRVETQQQQSSEENGPFATLDIEVK